MFLTSGRLSYHPINPYQSGSSSGIPALSAIASCAHGAGMALRRQTMPSRSFSGSELVESHEKLLQVKREREDVSDLQDRIQETWNNGGYLLHVDVAK